MKLYADKPGSSIKMLSDDRFVELLSSIIKKENISSVFESGTYLGTGSTHTIAKLFVENNKIPTKFVTVEANLEYYKAAKKNLSGYKFIQPIFGLSVDYFEAVKFLVNDEIFDDLENYPEIYIDHLSRPQHSYLKEIMIGVFQDNLHRQAITKSKGIFSTSKKEPIEFKNNALADFCDSTGNDKTLIILDSAAGIGFFEFLQVKARMGNKNYYLILDDIDHLKHFRSRNFIENHPEEFELIGLNKESGWLIARHKSN